MTMVVMAVGDRIVEGASVAENSSGATLRNPPRAHSIKSLDRLAAGRCGRPLLPPVAAVRYPCGCC